jgi:hypothetical protein
MHPIMKHLTSNRPDLMLISLAVSVWISVPIGSVTAFASGSVPPLLRSFRTSPNHVPEDRSVGVLGHRPDPQLGATFNPVPCILDSRILDQHWRELHL